MLAVATLFSVGPAVVRGQSALDGFDPSPNGTVYVVIKQPDGKAVVGGSFTTLTPNGGVPVTRNRIARLNSDGTIDTAFDPNVNSAILTILLQPDGKILIGGHFTNVGGQTRNRVARLNPDGTLDLAFNPNSRGSVLCIALQADGKILVGGEFTGTASIGGQDRNRIARLDPVTGLADSFNPNASLFVSAIAVQADGKILVGGSFYIVNGNPSIGGQLRNHLARLDPVTGLADSFNPNPPAPVKSLVVQPDGGILVGGQFWSIGGQVRGRIARLNPITGSADSFNPNANQTVSSISLAADGTVLVGGIFTNIGGQTRNHFARLNASTGLAADSFDPNANGYVESIVEQADGKILLAGYFSAIGGQPRNCVARLERDGRVDRTLKVSMAGTDISATAVQRDGKIVIGGNFATVLGMARNNLARLNSDGNLDPTFNPNADGNVLSVAVQADGKILVGGAFANVGGQTRSRFARLDAATGQADSFDPNANDSVHSIVVQADGSILAGGAFTGVGGASRNHIARLDPSTGMADSFDPNANNAVFSLAVQPDGKILAGGAFNGANSIGGQMRNHIARLDPVTGLADSFDPDASDDIYAIALQPGGKILTGGAFTTIGGQTRNYLARLDASSGLADSFDPNANDAIRSLAVQADGKIFASGSFTNIGGQMRNHIARLDSSTGLADSFDPNASDVVESLALLADGKLLAAGQFNTIGGQDRDGFARLSNGTAALQELSATRTTINWTRIGSSPQFTRVTFESSIDGTNYTFLGNGTATESTWTLTGLNLSFGQILFIRARGYYRSGRDNGSESTTELVRRGQVVEPTPTPTPTATATPPPTPTVTPPPTPSATVTPTPTAAPPLTPTPTPPNSGCYRVIYREYFDNVAPPALPPSWSTSSTPGAASCEPAGTCPSAAGWVTTGSGFDSYPNAAFHDAPACVTDSTLVSPVLTGAHELVFKHSFNLESGYDGAVLEISINGGPFVDIEQAGAGPGYNGTISNDFLSPLAGRRAWTGNSNGYIQTNLVIFSISGSYRFRFRLATDCSVAGTGWKIDTLYLGYVPECPTPTITPTPTPIPFTPTPTPTPTPLTPTPTPTPTATPTPDASQTPTPTPTATPDVPPPSQAQPLNISTRLRIQGGNNVGIGGFIINGNAPKTVAVRSVGPSLTAFGLSDALADPTLELRDSSGLLLKPNDNWQDDSADAAQLVSRGLALQDPKESGLMATLQPNASYTAILAGKNQTEGVGLIEIYDVNQAADSELANISTRGFVLTDNNVMIGGFILGGTYNTGMVVRGIGPSLAQFGLDPVLADPTLELHDSNGATLVSNDNWQDDAAAAAQLLALGLAPQNAKESALVVSLPPGAFTAILAGKNAGTGIGLVEIYNVH